MAPQRIALPPNVRALAIDYKGSGVWQVWLHTIDFIHGTYLRMYSDGKVVRVTEEPNDYQEFIIKEKG